MEKALIILVPGNAMWTVQCIAWSKFVFATKLLQRISSFIIHQTHYEKSDWSRAFIQFTIPCELDMINAISAADIAFIM